MFKLVSTICAARAAPHTIVSNRAACLTHISKCVSVQFFPLLKSSVFYSLALKKGSNNFASGSSFCSRRFVRSFFLGWISFFLRTATQYFTYFQNLSARSAIAVIILLTLVIMQYIVNIKQLFFLCPTFAQFSVHDALHRCDSQSKLSLYLKYKITKEREEISTIPKIRVKFFSFYLFIFMQRKSIIYIEIMCAYIRSKTIWKVYFLLS